MRRRAGINYWRYAHGNREVSNQAQATGLVEMCKQYDIFRREVGNRRLKFKFAEICAEDHLCVIIYAHVWSVEVY